MILLSFSLTIFPFSKGDRYFNRLNLWYKLVRVGNWDKAKILEKKLNQDDIRYYKDQYLPQAIENKLKEKYALAIKSIDDWIEIAQLESLQNHSKEAYRAIEEAHTLDPIRSDIEKIYFTFPR